MVTHVNYQTGAMHNLAEPEIHDRLEAVLDAPSLYDETIRLLARRGFDIATECTARNWRQRYTGHPSVRAAWLEIYRNTETHWDLYELGEELVDLEDWFQQRRFRHVTTVERIIGRKRGTGGTSGVDYLQNALNIRFLSICGTSAPSFRFFAAGPTRQCRRPPTQVRWGGTRTAVRPAAARQFRRPAMAVDS